MRQALERLGRMLVAKLKRTAGVGGRIRTLPAAAQHAGKELEPRQGFEPWT